MSLEMEHVRTWKLNWNMSLQMEHVRTEKLSEHVTWAGTCQDMKTIWNMWLSMENVRTRKLSGTYHLRWIMSGGYKNYLEHVTRDGTCHLRWNMSGHENCLEHVAWDGTCQDMKTIWSMSLEIDVTWAEHVRTWKPAGTCHLRWNMSGHEN